MTISKWTKCTWCVKDSYTRLHDGSHRQIHLAMTAPLLFFTFHNISFSQRTVGLNLEKIGSLWYHHFRNNGKEILIYATFNYDYHFENNPITANVITFSTIDQKLDHYIIWLETGWCNSQNSVCECNILLSWKFSLQQRARILKRN